MGKIKGIATLQDGSKIRKESEKKPKTVIRRELTEEANKQGIIKRITVRRYKDN
jgi:hypothetical protein